MRVDKDRAYLLHKKPFRETSAIAYLLTQQNGKVGFIVSHAKNRRTAGTQKTAKLAILQPCHPISLSYQLKNNLSKIDNMESIQTAVTPHIKHFMLYQYAQELLLKLLPEHHPSDPIFATYEDFLALLQQQKPHFALRLLELAIIDCFDGISGLYHTPQLRRQVAPQTLYALDSHFGICDNTTRNGARITGEQLNAFNYLVSLYQHRQQSKDLNYPSLEAPMIETLARATQPINAFFIARLLGNNALKTKNIYRELQAMDLT